MCNKINKTNKGLINYFFLTLKHLYYLATSRICIVDSYCLAVSLPKHKKNLTIIQIWHAIATVKKFGYQTVKKEYGRGEKLSKLLNMHKNYDYVISGSEAMIPVFSETFGVEPSKIKSIGTPRIDYLLKQENSIRQKILQEYPSLNKKKVILYAPTFRKDKNIDISKILNEIDFEKFNLIVKTHPIKTQIYKNINVFNCPEFSTLELLTVADYVITDYSAISVEASILNKQVYFYVFDLDEYIEKNGLNIDLCKEMKGMCYKNFKHIYKKIESNITYPKKMEEFKNKYVSNLNGTSGFILANFIVNGVWIEIDDKKIN